MGLKRSWAKTKSRERALKKFIKHKEKNKGFTVSEEKIMSTGFNRGWKDCLKWLKKRGLGDGKK